MSSNISMNLFLITLLFVSLISVDSQILRRQYISVSDSQQIQVPVRRINIPYDLSPSGQSSSDKIPDLKEKSPNSECPTCLQKHLVQHYMARGCTPVIKGGCDCPSRYECPTGPTSARLITENNVCWYRGRAYPLAQTIPNQNLCLRCKCVAVGTGVTIECSGDEHCSAQSSEHKHKTNGTIDLNECRISECDLHLDNQFRTGCTPVYTHDNCCPRDYICPQRNPLRIQGLESGSLMCEFEGRKYPIGSTLYSESRCVDCVCRVPPQFTCIKHINCK